MKYFPGDGN